MSSFGNENQASQTDAERARVDELAERIQVLSELPEEELGEWTALDSVLIAVLGVVGPLLVLYGFAP